VLGEWACWGSIRVGLVRSMGGIGTNRSFTFVSPSAFAS